MALLAGLVAGCSGDGSSCSAADDAVRNEIVDSFDFPFSTGTGDGGGSTVQDFDVEDTTVVPIPDGDRAYGAADIVVLSGAVATGESDAETWTTVRGDLYYVLDGQGRPLAPLDSFSQQFFDVDLPDPGWTAWADGVDAEIYSYPAYDCVNGS